MHQDGLVHVSQLADRFVKDPAEVVKVQQQVRVTVLEVDLAAQAHRAVDAHEPAGRAAARGAHVAGGTRARSPRATRGDSRPPGRRLRAAARRAGPRPQRPPQGGQPPKPSGAAFSNAFADAFSKLRKS